MGVLRSGAVVTAYGREEAAASAPFAPTEAEVPRADPGASPAPRSCGACRRGDTVDVAPGSWLSSFPACCRLPGDGASGCAETADKILKMNFHYIEMAAIKTQVCTWLSEEGEIRPRQLMIPRSKYKHKLLKHLRSNITTKEKQS
ncbi:hypothetical protein VULLAG_LOCUS23435 [Vulpes lagopus]